MHGADCKEAGKTTRKQSVLFLAKFFVIFGLLYAGLYAADLSPLQNWLAWLEAGLLGLESSGSIVAVDGEGFEVGYACTGLVSGALFAAIVFAMRKPSPAHKLGLALLGAGMLWVLNLARLYVVLAAATMYGGFAAEVVHVASWFFVSGAVIALWYYATKKICGIRNFEGFL